MSLRIRAMRKSWLRVTAQREVRSGRPNLPQAGRNPSPYPRAAKFLPAKNRQEWTSPKQAERVCPQSPDAQTRLTRAGHQWHMAPAQGQEAGLREESVQTFRGMPQREAELRARKKLRRLRYDQEDAAQPAK